MKTCDPQGGPIFWPQGHNLNILGRGILDYATYKLLGLMLYAWWFQIRFFFSFFPI